jgi:cytoskeleton protein RodZ
MSFDLGKIGQMLKVAREEHHLSLQEVSEVLFIRRRIIEAIETGNWEILPHAVYVKGYVEQYAAFIGIRDNIDEQLKQDNACTQHYIPLEISKTEDVKTWWGARKKAVGLSAVGAGIIVFLVFQNIQKPSYSVVSSPQKPSYSVVSPYQTGPRDLRTVSGGLYETSGEAIIAETKKLMIACQQRTWVRIVIDGAEKKEFIMNPEEVVVLSAKDGFDLLIGNAGGVKLFYNGKDTGFAGEEGEVRRINLPEAG